MQSSSFAAIRLLVRGPGCLLAVVWLASACSTPGTRSAAPVEVWDDSGFTITEQIDVGSGVRGDFEDAMERIEEEDYVGGIALLEEVIVAAPDATAAYINLGIAYARAGDLEKAQARIAKALELNPRHPAAYNEQGIVLRKLGRFEDARASYLEALELYPDFHFARRNLAILCDVYLSDLGCAVEHYELYTRAVPGDEAAAMWVADLRNRIQE